MGRMIVLPETRQYVENTSEWRNKYDAEEHNLPLV
jgi:hypothetical protein